MNLLQKLALLTALTTSSCASMGTEPEGFGGKPVPVKVIIERPAPSPQEASTAKALPVRAWVLNAPGLQAIGGREALTDFATLLEQGDAAQVEDARKKLIAALNNKALFKVLTPVQTVEIETKLHTVVVEDGQQLLHRLVNVAMLDYPYKIRFQL